LRIITGDGRFYIKTSKKTYDIIIRSAPDPYTAQINRLYTLEFFREVKKRLNGGGILSLACEASEHYIGPEMGEYIRSVYKTLQEAGFNAAIIPGETVRFIASVDKEAVPEISPVYFQKMLDEKGVDAHFVRDYYLNSKLSPGRVAYAKKLISETSSSSVNTDFKPISYYYGIILWAAHFRPGPTAFLASLNENKVWYALLVIFALLLAFRLMRQKRKSGPVFIAIGTTGFAEMAIEINIMLAFQIIYGYLYYKLGLIITFFMAGLFTGAYIITKNLGQIKLPLRALRNAKIALGLLSLLLIPVFKALSAGTTAFSLYLGANLIFPLLMFLTGAIGGVQFPLAGKILLGEKGRVGEIAGTLYGIDLMGAMAGGLLVATIFIPIIGLFQCLIAVGVLNIISSIIIPTEAEIKT
jgi:spermidine synthase